MVTDSVYLTRQPFFRTYMEGQRGAQMQHAHATSPTNQKKKKKDPQRHAERKYDIILFSGLLCIFTGFSFCCSVNVKHITHLTFKFQDFPLKS